MIQDQSKQPEICSSSPGRVQVSAGQFIWDRGTLLGTLSESRKKLEREGEQFCDPRGIRGHSSSLFGGAMYPVPRQKSYQTERGKWDSRGGNRFRVFGRGETRG